MVKVGLLPCWQKNLDLMGPAMKYYVRTSVRSAAARIDFLIFVRHDGMV